MRRAGGVANTWFALDSEAGYPEAPGERIAKTYSQLRDGPKTGETMFAELVKQDWRLPDPGRRYLPSEFNEHLRYMVRKKRLHVLRVNLLSPDAALGLGVDLKAALTRAAGGGTVASLLHEVERVAKYATGRDKAPLGNEGTTGAMRALVSAFAHWALDDTGLQQHELGYVVS